MTRALSGRRRTRPEGPGRPAEVPTRRRTARARGRSRTQPGVYRFRDARGRVIYVGKAKSLRSRLSSYFQDIANLHPRTATMVTTAASVEWTVVEHRGRGAPAGVLLDQGVRPAVQREVPRRQVLPVARGHPRRGVPAGDGRAAAPSARASATSAPTPTPGRSARPSTCCCGSSRCARAATASSSVPARSAGPCLLGYIDKCSAPCVGRVSAEEHREIVDDFCDFMAGQTNGFVKRIEKEMYAASDGPGLREGGPAARRPRRAQPGAGEAGRRARRRHRRRRHRARGGPARGRGPDLLRPRRPGPRPARLGRRQGRRRRHRRPGRALPAPGSTTGRTPTPIPREILVPGAAPDAAPLTSCWRSDLRGGKVSIRVPQRGEKRNLMETVARNAAPVAGAAQDQAGQRPDHPQPGAGGDPGGARPGDRRRCASSATTSPTCRAPRWSRRWWSSRTGCPARASTAGS